LPPCPRRNLLFAPVYFATLPWCFSFWGALGIESPIASFLSDPCCDVGLVLRGPLDGPEKITGA
jgi:hypothetical protein